MRLLILVSSSFLMGCDPVVEYVYIEPDIPSELLTPCPISQRQARTVNELAMLATEHLRSAECANSKIVANAKIHGGKKNAKTGIVP